MAVRSFAFDFQFHEIYEYRERVRTDVERERHFGWINVPKSGDTSSYAWFKDIAPPHVRKLTMSMQLPNSTNSNDRIYLYEGSSVKKKKRYYTNNDSTYAGSNVIIDPVFNKEFSQGDWTSTASSPDSITRFARNNSSQCAKFGNVSGMTTTLKTTDVYFPSNAVPRKYLTIYYEGKMNATSSESARLSLGVQLFFTDGSTATITPQSLDITRNNTVWTERYYRFTTTISHQSKDIKDCTVSIRANGKCVAYAANIHVSPATWDLRDDPNGPQTVNNLEAWKTDYESQMAAHFDRQNIADTLGTVSMYIGYIGQGVGYINEPAGTIIGYFGSAFGLYDTAATAAIIPNMATGSNQFNTGNYFQHYTINQQSIDDWLPWTVDSTIFGRVNLDSSGTQPLDIVIDIGYAYGYDTFSPFFMDVQTFHSINRMKINLLDTGYTGIPSQWNDSRPISSPPDITCVHELDSPVIQWQIAGLPAIAGEYRILKIDSSNSQQVAFGAFAPNGSIIYMPDTRNPGSSTYKLVTYIPDAGIEFVLQEDTVQVTVLDSTPMPTTEPTPPPIPSPSDGIRPMNVTSNDQFSYCGRTDRLR